MEKLKAARKKQAGFQEKAQLDTLWEGRTLGQEKEPSLLEEGASRIADDVKAVGHLLLGDDERGGEADDVAVGGLGDEAALLHLHAEGHGVLVAPGLDDHGVEQALAAHGGDDVVADLLLEVGEGRTEDLAGLLRALREVLINEDLEGGLRDAAGERGAAVGGAVLSGFDVEHDLVVAKHGGHGVHAATEGLAEDDDVRADVLVVHAEHAAGAAEASLDLVCDHEHVVLGAEVAHALEVALVRDEDAGLALDGLEHVRGDVGVALELGLERGEVVVGHELETGHVGAKVGVAGGVRGGGDGGEGASPEVVLGEDDDSLVARDALLDVAPAAGELDGGLTALHAGVHGEHFVVAEEVGDVLLVLAEAVVVEGTGGEGEGGGLVDERLHELGVGVALVDGRVRAEEVEVFAALDVPDLGALALGEGDGERGVVVAAELVLERHERLGGALAAGGSGGGALGARLRHAGSRAGGVAGEHGGYLVAAWRAGCSPLSLARSRLLSLSPPLSVLLRPSWAGLGWAGLRRMQHDDLIWSCIGSKKLHCSYRASLGKKGDFCRNEFNVNGLCSRTTCPLANSQYGTIKEIEGKCYLYTKTIERAHTPKYLWERIELPRNYTQALGVIDEHMAYWNKSNVLKCKQRLTKIHQYLIRMRKLRKKIKPKLVGIDKKVEQRERKREEKALKAALVEKAIEKELLDRLKQGTYGDIYNFPMREYEKVLDDEEEVEEEEEDEFAENDEEEDQEDYVKRVEYVEGPDDSDESDLEDLDGWPMGEGEDDDEEEDDDDDDDDEEEGKGEPKLGADGEEDGARKRKLASGKRGAASGKKRKGGAGAGAPRVEIEYEQEEEHEHALSMH
eukprot:CAMPEP_0202097642 /NCGR_PEP_ID=MMETSP0965-20130614/1310_1 /ASSEMBLY_ACC=CAM_ASM_000507 /TAXON_ID=4773 /ORGANISM="Schizochytrium aggregatum, Strain ATCC28209" /LENGTH=849 /DNA_ID=CAMNT_0048666027 /DNA_START=98 /DNA_END=2648 /DNA_ORIENTATION=+